MIKNAAIYVRVSTAGQAEVGHSLANQKKICTKYAEANGLTVVAVYEDAGVSGTTDERPGIKQAISEIDTYQHLVIYDSTRLGRAQEINHGLRAIFNKGGVTIHAVAEGGAIQPNTQMAIWMTAIMDARAESENLDRSTKSRSGKYDAVKDGNLQVGTAPFGYMLERKGMNALGKGGKTVLVINDDQAIGVRLAFKEFSKGTSIAEIARKLQKAKVKKSNGKKWTRENVKDMLERQTYSGFWTYGKNQTFTDDRARKPISVKVPRIITKAVFDKAQTKLHANSRANAKNVKHPYLLRGRIECSQCDVIYTAKSQSRATSTNVNFYYQHKPTKDHDYHNLKRDDVEDRVKSFIDTALLDPDTLAKLVGDQSDDTREINRNTLDRLDKAEAKLTKNRASLMQMRVDGEISKQDWLDKETEYNEKLEPIQNERAQVLEDIAQDEIELVGYEQFLKDQEAHLAEGGNFDGDKPSKKVRSFEEYTFYTELMDIRVQVSPETEYLSADKLGIEQALLKDVTDSKAGPASCYAA